MNIKSSKKSLYDLKIFRSVLLGTVAGVICISTNAIAQDLTIATDGTVTGVNNTSENIDFSVYTAEEAQAIFAEKQQYGTMLTERRQFRLSEMQT